MPWEVVEYERMEAWSAEVGKKRDGVTPKDMGIDGGR